jgi:hypothetical protein
MPTESPHFYQKQCPHRHPSSKIDSPSEGAEVQTFSKKLKHNFSGICFSIQVVFLFYTYGPRLDA